LIFYLNVSINNNEFVDGDLHYLVVKGISKRYLPRPEILSFQVLTSRTFVEWNLSSSQMALKGLQKIDVIGFHLIFDVKNNGGEFFLNINPVPISHDDFNFLAKIVFLLPSI